MVMRFVSTRPLSIELPFANSRRPRCSVAIVTAFLTAVFVLPHAVGAQTHYTFTRIADTLQVPSVTSVQCVGLGNSGTVIWTVAGEVWRGDGLSNASRVSANALSICGSINDQDEIAYFTYTPPSTLPLSLVRNANGTLTTLARSDVSPYAHNGRTYISSLANNGSAVFHGGPSTACGSPSALSGYGIYVGPFGPTVYDPICDSSVDINESTVNAGTMNDNLVVAFIAQTKTGTQGIYRGSLTPLVQDGSSGVSLIFARPVINNSGRVAFLASINGGPASIYTTSDGVSFARAGQFPNNNGLFAINDSGKVAYTLSGGIYTGVDLVADKVIVPGDSLDGSTLQGAISYMEGLNNSGQVVFFAQLADGRRGIYRADPNRPPVASNGTASVMAGASVSDALIATDLDGDSLAYSIVTNGTKGTATITNAATGAYTYAANVGSIGTDTFTFTANDGFANSNVATITLTIAAPSACATDISASVTVATQGPVKINKKTGRYAQTVTLKNGDGAASGPVSLVFDSLSSNATLFGSAGTTSCTSPAGSPYINVDIGADTLFSPRERATITLEFVNPTGQPVTYATRVLTGVGSR